MLENKLNLAIHITAEAFLDIKDKIGQPYILHCLAVMDGVAHLEDCEVSQAAVMHDLLEDTEYTEQILLDKGFSLRTVNMIKDVTRLPNESYEHFIQRIKNSSFGSIEIKKADLRHNSDLTRMIGITNEDTTRATKYRLAYYDLCQIVYR